MGKNSDALKLYSQNRSDRSKDPNDYVKPYSYLEQLLTSQRLGGDQQALVVARHSGCCQVLIGQLDVFAVVLQERHDSGQQHARFALSLKMATESQTFSLKIEQAEGSDPRGPLKYPSYLSDGGAVLLSLAAAV